MRASTKKRGGAQDNGDSFFIMKSERDMSRPLLLSCLLFAWAGSNVMVGSMAIGDGLSIPFRNLLAHE